jgi:tetratricopeptide (TPR) repeat protein
MPDRMVISEMVDRSLAHYRVLGRLGQGGWGEVLLAEDQRLGRRVALKVLRPDLTGNPCHLERFQREARSIASLNHPNIVTIYSVEEAEGLHFLVLELIEGETLAARLAAGGPMPLDRVLALALPLTEALAAAHAHGIVHRDLKPRNIMVSREGRVKILDFGIARLARAGELEDGTETGLTKTGGIVGTTSYMSPEQILECPVDHRSDLFSLGVVLYEMATGQRPFQARSQAATLASILHDMPPPPSLLVPSLPGRFDEIVSLCLAKEPFLRYRGATALRNDLSSLANGADAALDSTVAGAASLPRRASSAVPSTRLPARPRCFGREAEILELVETLCSDPPRPVPVLGPAGAGKSTIALAALHDSQVAERFGKRRWLVRCQGAASRDSLVEAIARVVCPEAIQPLESKILQALDEAPAVLVLDNLEAPWEQDTAAVEELLGDLAAVPGLALAAALRGEQRPFGPSWREAIHAGPLDPAPARNAFLAVAGERYRNDPDLDPLLLDLDGLALAVVLLASQAEGEPDLAGLRQRRRDQRTALLHRGQGRERQHSLDVSLALSIDSPRMTAESRRLLSLLGLLPEGMAREDIEALLPESGAEAASVLRRVGLAFDQGPRLRVLAPIREHVQRSHPPRDADLHQAVDHYLALARLGEDLGGPGGAQAADRLRAELGTLEPMILLGLQRADPIPAIHSALAYAEAVRCLGSGGLAIIGCARRAARTVSQAKLEADCLRKLGDIDLSRARYEQARERYEQAREIYRRAGHLHGQASCAAHLADIALLRGNSPAALALAEEALELTRRTGSRLGEANCLFTLGEVARRMSRHEEAETLLEESLLRFQQIGATLGVANCLASLTKLKPPGSTGRRRHVQARQIWAAAGRIDQVRHEVAAAAAR